MCCEADTYGWENDNGKVEKDEFQFKTRERERERSSLPSSMMCDLPARVCVVGGPGHLVCQLGH